MKRTVKSISCQLRTIAQAAEGKPRHVNGRIFRTFTSEDLYEISLAARDAYEALLSAFVLAKQKERAVSEDGDGPPDGGAL
jgi:hypothetical protein